MKGCNFNWGLVNFFYFYLYVFFLFRKLLIYIFIYMGFRFISGIWFRFKIDIFWVFNRIQRIISDFFKKMGNKGGYEIVGFFFFPFF